MKTLVALAAKCVGVAVLLVSGSGEASAQSLLTIRDGATGEVRTFTPENSSFRLSGDQRSVYFSAGISSPMARAMGSWWSIKLEAPEGESLRPGRFLNAGCTGWARTGRAPGLEVTDNNPVCKPPYRSDAVWGSFDIRQIAFAADGSVKSLEAAFAQRIDSPNGPAITGTLRYEAAPLQFTVSAGRTFPWGALSQNNYGDSSFFSLAGDPTGIVYEASVPRDQWRIRIAPPTGKVLAVGRYPTSHQADAHHAQLGIWRTVDGKTCQSTGELNIEDLHVDGDGQISKLRASFLFRCSGYAAPLRGTIRHHL